MRLWFYALEFWVQASGFGLWSLEPRLVEFKVVRQGSVCALGIGNFETY